MMSSRPWHRSRVAATWKQEVAGLKGVASGAIKAERAIKELVSGHGLMRLGSQLEGVIPLLGGPAGLGMAIGAVVVAAVDTLPALKKWFDTWQDGGQVMVDAHKALTEFDDAQKSMHKDMRKHALHDIDKQIEVLEAEDRASKAAGLPEYNKQGGEYSILQRLQARSKAGHDEEKWEKTASGIGLTKEQKKMESAVKEAVEEAGGVAAVIGDESNEVARNVLQSAIEGDRQSIETLKRWSPEFASIWQALDPVAIRQRKRQEAGEKTIADVNAKTAKNVEHREKQAEREDRFDRYLVTSEEDRVAGENAADVKKAERDAKKAEHDAKVAADKAKLAAEQAERDREKWDREHTPEARRTSRLAAERNEEMGMAQDVQAARAGAGDTMAAQMGPAELQQVVAEVGRNRMMNSTLGFTLAQQVDYYMSQLEAKMVADFTRGMGQHDRSAQLINPRGGH